MPQEMLSPYEPTTLLQNVSYGLPAVLCNVTATVACETSTNGTAWAPLISGSETNARYIRCSSGTSVVICKPVMAGIGGESGASALPTAALGQVLISQGVGVQPIFSTEATLNRLWLNNAFYELNRIGLGGIETINRNSTNGTLVLSVSDFMVTIPERTLAGLYQPSYVGTLANISDSTVNTWGTVIVGGGSFHVLGRFNGTNWTVVGK